MIYLSHDSLEVSQKINRHLRGSFLTDSHLTRSIFGTGTPAMFRGTSSGCKQPLRPVRTKIDHRNCSSCWVCGFEWENTVLARSNPDNAPQRLLRRNSVPIRPGLKITTIKIVSGWNTTSGRSVTVTIPSVRRLRHEKFSNSVDFRGDRKVASRIFAAMRPTDLVKSKRLISHQKNHLLVFTPH